MVTIIPRKFMAARVYHIPGRVRFNWTRNAYGDLVMDQVCSGLVMDRVGGSFQQWVAIIELIGD